MPAQVLFPDNLPPGLILDGWRVVGRRGRGTYGAVYRAQRLGDEGAGPVALKLAIHPGDERFTREAEVLARVHHPGVPRILGRGQLECGPYAQPHPYLVMQWVDGVPLYVTPGSPRFSLKGALLALAQVARALAALHAAGCLHRDVKGDNVLVDSSGRVVLVDFGCGTWATATELTEGPLPPGTARYRAPEALRWRERHWRSGKRYEAAPADDVYALGVMAYRLVTGYYPPSAEEAWESGHAPRQPAHALNPAVPLALSHLIEQLLADTPKARETATGAAEQLEGMAAMVDAKAPLIGDDISRALAPTVRARRPGPPPQRPGLSLAAPVLAVVMAYCFLMATHPPDGAEQADAGVDMDVGGAVGLADAAVEDMPASVVGMPSAGVPPSSFGVPMPKVPLEGQRRPPCDPVVETVIHGACWIEVARAKAPCGLKAYDYEGACYVPSFNSPRPSTSDKP